MFGPPKDVEDECNARLELGDDYGDNSCTCKCRLSPGHGGEHEERTKTLRPWGIGAPEEQSYNIVIKWCGDDTNEDNQG